MMGWKPSRSPYIQSMMWRHWKGGDDGSATLVLSDMCPVPTNSASTSQSAAVLSPPPARPSPLFQTSSACPPPAIIHPPFPSAFYISFPFASPRSLICALSLICISFPSASLLPAAPVPHLHSVWWAVGLKINF